jgi:hypothetical protein
MTLLWDHILQRFNATSLSLQKTSIELGYAVKLLQSLRDFVADLRTSPTTFNDFEEQAKLAAVVKSYRTEVTRRKIPKRYADHVAQTESQVFLVGNQEFRVNTFNVILDKLLSALHHRIDAYTEVHNCFGFLYDFSNESSDGSIYASAAKLADRYKTDIDPSFCNEMKQWRNLVKIERSAGNCDTSTIGQLKMMKKLQVGATFPNVETALRIYLTLPVANCESERSFSKLKRIKSEIRSCMKQTRLNALAIMSIESDVLRRLDFKEIIHTFAAEKARKKPCSI